MKLNYQKLGEGQPLIILHGLFGSLDNWRTMGRHFSKTFEVYLVDQRNHGKSPHSDSFTYIDMSEDLLEFVNEHHLEDPIILGHSMGGKVAMQYAVKYNNLINQLIVVDIAPISYPVHHADIIKGLKSINFNKVKDRKEADEKLAETIDSKIVRQFLLKGLYWKEPDELAFRYNLPVIEKNIEMVGEGLQPFEKYEGKTLFIGGELSGYINMPADESKIKAHFPSAIIKMFPNVGHWIHAEAPKDLYNEVMKFCK